MADFGEGHCSMDSGMSIAGTRAAEETVRGVELADLRRLLDSGKFKVHEGVVFLEVKGRCWFGTHG